MQGMGREIGKETPVYPRALAQTTGQRKESLCACEANISNLHSIYILPAQVIQKPEEEISRAEQHSSTKVQMKHFNLPVALNTAQGVTAPRGFFQFREVPEISRVAGPLPVKSRIRRQKKSRGPAVTHRSSSAHSSCSPPAPQAETTN